MSKMDDNGKRRLIERGIVRALIAHLKHKGFAAWRTYDGGEFEYPAGSADAAVAACFNLDEVSLRFAPLSLVATFKAAIEESNARAERGEPRANVLRDAKAACVQAEHGVLLVMGNGEDIISDWNYRDGDPDGFNAAMDQFFAQDGEHYGRDLEEVGRRSATDADRIAILAGAWLGDTSALAVLFKGRGEGLRRIGEIPGCFEGDVLAAADVLLRKLSLSAERVNIVEVDAYPGGWRKRAIVAHG